MKKKIIIVDLDGTLYDSRQREGRAIERDWEQFHMQSSFDKPYEDVRQLIESLNNTGLYHIVAVTGRNEKWRRITMDWLLEWEVNLDDVLMRPDNDWRPDHELKPDFFEAHYEKDDVLFVLEDRDKVVAAWRDKGYNCWQVRVGGY